jgi:hypothetical protein
VSASWVPRGMASRHMYKPFGGFSHVNPWLCVARRAFLRWEMSTKSAESRRTLETGRSAAGGRMATVISAKMLLYHARTVGVRCVLIVLSRMRPTTRQTYLAAAARRVNSSGVSAERYTVRCQWRRPLRCGSVTPITASMERNAPRSRSVKLRDRRVCEDAGHRRTSSSNVSILR